MEVIFMSDNSQNTPLQAQGAETAEEIIGVLTAISIVSKRMAKKLALLEQRSEEKEGVSVNGKTTTVPINAN